MNNYNIKWSIWHWYDTNMTRIRHRFGMYHKWSVSTSEVILPIRIWSKFVFNLYVCAPQTYIYIYICLFSLFLSKYTKYMFVVEAEIMASNVFFSKIRGDIVFVLKRDSIMGCKIHPPDHDDLSWDPTPLQGGLRQMCDNSQLIYKN